MFQTLAGMKGTLITELEHGSQGLWLTVDGAPLYTSPPVPPPSLPLLSRPNFNFVVAGLWEEA